VLEYIFYVSKYSFLFGIFLCATQQHFATVEAAYQDRVDNIGEDKSPTGTKAPRPTKKQP
jgi:hypothetical protein